MFKFIVLLYLICSVELLSVKQKKTELTNICNQITNKGLLPLGIAIEFDEYILNIQLQNQNDKMLIGVISFVGAVIGSIIIPPLFAASGLHGAAAMSSGLATLGGGSIASGGFGMLGGQVVLNLAGTILTQSAVSFVGQETNFYQFMETKQRHYIDTIIIGDYHINGHFTYYNGINYLDGSATITKNNFMMFRGTIYCEENCSLLGEFY